MKARCAYDVFKLKRKKQKQKNNVNETKCPHNIIFYFIKYIKFNILLFVLCTHTHIENYYLIQIEYEIEFQLFFYI